MSSKRYLSRSLGRINWSPHLRDTAKKGPVEAQLEVAKTAQSLGQLADRLQDEGDILSQLRAVKNAAAVHRDRVQDIPKGNISEADRTAVLAKWNAILQQADRAQAKVLNMRDKLLGAITELRVRQVGISEQLLAGGYEDAVKSLNQWLDELEKLINDFRASEGRKPSKMRTINDGSPIRSGIVTGLKVFGEIAKADPD